MYHLQYDPDELVNVVEQNEYRDVVNQMNEWLAKWYLETGDAVPYRLDPRGGHEKLPDYLSMPHKK